MIDFSPKLMLEIMHDRPGGGDRGRHLCATESIKRFCFEMLAQSERRLLRQKRITVIAERVIELAKFLLLLIAHQQLGWRNARQLVEE